MERIRVCGKLSLAFSFVLTPREPKDSLLPFVGWGALVLK
jgi:hypothetical protein